MITELCKRLDGTTCGRNVDKESSEVGWSHVGDATSPAGPDCTLPPVCWTCGEAIDLGGGAERAFHIVRISDVSGAPILGDSADGTKPEPGQERCRRQKATECAQGRELCSGDLYVDPPHHQVPTCIHGFTVDVLHHADGSPCLGPECKAQPDEDPGTCIQCGAEFELVRPGKFQPTCECWDKPSEPIGTSIPPDSPLRHDTDDGPCECGAWHRPAEPGIVERLRQGADWLDVEKPPEPCPGCGRALNWPFESGRWRWIEMTPKGEKTGIPCEDNSSFMVDGYQHEHQDQWVDCPGKLTEPGIVERLRWHAEIYRRANPPGRPVDEADELDEAAAHIEGLEARLPTLSEALVKERAERARLEAENQRLREALRVSACHRNAMVPRKGIAQGLYIKSIHGNGDCGECPPCLERRETP